MSTGPKHVAAAATRNPLPARPMSEPAQTSAPILMPPPTRRSVPPRPLLVIPWDETDFYKSAADTTMRPGGPTAYTPPRPLGRSPDDFTTFHPGQATWSCQNIPDLFYMLLPPPGWKEFGRSPKPDPIVDQNGNIVYERWPEEGVEAKPLLDFKVLPMQLCTNEHWWYFWVIKRYDPRIRWKDITMRMKGPNRPKGNSLQMMAARRWAKACYVLNWQTKGHDELQQAIEDKLMALLSKQQVDNNTTRGLSPGLINPAIGEAGGRIPYPSITAVHAGRRSECKLQRTSTPQTSPTTSTGTVEQDRDMARKRKEDSSDDGYYSLDEDYVPDDVQTSKSASKKSASNKSASKQSGNKDTDRKKKDERRSPNTSNPPAREGVMTLPSIPRHIAARPYPGAGRMVASDFDIAPAQPPLNVPSWYSHRPTSQIEDADDTMIISGPRTSRIRSTYNQPEVPDDTIVVSGRRTSRVRSTYNNPSTGRSMTTNHATNTFGYTASTAPQSTYHRSEASAYPPGLNDRLPYVPPLPIDIPSITPGTNAYAILDPSLLPQALRPANYRPATRVNQQPTPPAPVVPSMHSYTSPSANHPNQPPIHSAPVVPSMQSHMPPPANHPGEQPTHPSPVAPRTHAHMPPPTNRANQQTTRVIPPLHTYMGPAAMRRNPQPTGPRMRDSPYGTANPTLSRGPVQGPVLAPHAVINPRATFNISVRSALRTMANPGLNLHPHPSHLSYQTPPVPTGQGIQPAAANPQADPEANQQAAGRRVVLPSTYPQGMYDEDDWTPFGPSSLEKLLANYPDSEGAGSNEEEKR